MAYRKLIVGAAFRIALMLACGVASGVLVYLPGYYFSAFLCIVFTLFLFVEVLRFISSSNRKTILFFGALNAGDFTVRMNDKDSDQQLVSALNGLASQMQRIALEKSKRDEILQHLIDNIPFGILCFRYPGTCELMNEHVLQQLGLRVINHYDDIKKGFPVLTNIISGMQNGERRMCRIQNESDDAETLLMRTDFTIAGDRFLLLTFGNVTSVMYKREMESWSKMMRVLHHEMVNGITPVVSLSDSLLQSLKDEKLKLSIDEMREAMKAIHQRAEGLLRFTAGYRTFTRISAPKKIHIDTEYFVNGILRGLRIPGNIIVAFESDKFCSIEMDAGHLEQVLINLILNASDAIGDKKNGRIDIEIRKDEKNLRLIIRDNGCGMSTEELAKAFIPFFTTKDHGQGIGLSLSRELIRLNGGQLLINSKIGHGTEVKILI